MTYRGISLELHFKLPLIKRCNSAQVWHELVHVEGCRYQLPLELNLVMLFNHCRQHQWEIVIKLLADSAFLIRQEGTPDWSRIERLAKRFQIASPALFFASFSDFFPATTMPPQPFPVATRQTFRELLLTSRTLYAHKHEVIMSMEERFSIRWWFARFKGMRPGSIRSQTHNPRGNYGKLFVDYWQIARKKLCALWRYRHGTNNELVQKRLAELKQIEKILSWPCR